MLKPFQNGKKERKSKNKGFSLIEVLLAVVLLGLIAAPLAQLLYSSYGLNVKSKRYMAASDVAQSMMETISSLAYEDVTTPKASGSVVVKGVKSLYGEDSCEQDVVYGDFKFKVKWTFTKGDTTKKYYTVKVDCQVVDNDDLSKTKGQVLFKTSTKIMNKPIITG